MREEQAEAAEEKEEEEEEEAEEVGSVEVATEEALEREHTGGRAPPRRDPHNPSPACTTIPRVARRRPRTRSCRSLPSPPPLTPPQRQADTRQGLLNLSEKPPSDFLLAAYPKKCSRRTVDVCASLV